MESAELKEIVQKGESDVLEFKKSTSLLHAIAETLCGFLNGKGGKVIVGVTSEKKLVGQHVSDNTLQEIASIFAKFEAPAAIEQDRISVKDQNEVIVLTALPRKTDVPYTWEGCAYQELDRLHHGCLSKFINDYFWSENIIIIVGKPG
jgi:ATP-dependent DNA helicase RecG